MKVAMMMFSLQDWQEIVKLYEKDNVNLGNEIFILLRSLPVRYQVLNYRYLSLLYITHVAIDSLFIQFAQIIELQAVS